MKFPWYFIYIYNIYYINDNIIIIMIIRIITIIIILIYMYTLYIYIIWIDMLDRVWPTHAHLWSCWIPFFMSDHWSTPRIHWIQCDHCSEYLRFTGTLWGLANNNQHFGQIPHGKIAQPPNMLASVVLTLSFFINDSSINAVVTMGYISINPSL